ncbi:hypothetical protein HFN51_04245 [Rhizobium leguminosarum]|nr:hypothetical protein [Rhizobium leguminosarum]
MTGINTTLKAGDVAKCVTTGCYNLTKGKLYIVHKVSNADGSNFVNITDDTGASATAFASRFWFHTRPRVPSAHYLSVFGTPASIENARAERKAAEVARKEKGKARAAAQNPVAQKPLLFTSLTEEDVHAAVASYLSGKLPKGLRVVDMEKTTVGYKITLDAPR